MTRLIAVAFSFGLAFASSLAPTSSARAMPLDQGLRPASGEITLVREACGLGRQYSDALRRCVADTAGAEIRDVRKDVVRCGVGLVWNDRLRRCVRI